MAGRALVLLLAKECFLLFLHLSSSPVSPGARGHRRPLRPPAAAPGPSRPVIGAGGAADPAQAVPMGGGAAGAEARRRGEEDADVASACERDMLYHFALEHTTRSFHE